VVGEDVPVIKQHRFIVVVDTLFGHTRRTGLAERSPSKKDFISAEAAESILVSNSSLIGYPKISMQF
jgi:hypothetical protein